MRRPSLPPVLERELRVQARSPVTVLLRLFAGVLAMGGLLSLGEMMSSRRFGGAAAFVTLHVFTVLMTLALTPAMMADNLVRDRRGGTLQLLFLTPLTAREILAGKLAAQALRALTMWLAAAPVLVLPLMAGGVSAGLVLLFLALEAVAIALGLLAGAMASANNSSTIGSTLLAYVILLGVGLLTIPFWALLGELRNLGLPGQVMLFASVLGAVALGLFVLFRAAAGSLADSRLDETPYTPPEFAPATAETVPAYLPTWFERIQAAERRVANDREEASADEISKALAASSKTNGPSPQKPTSPPVSPLDRWLAKRRLALRSRRPMVWAWTRGELAQVGAFIWLGVMTFAAVLPLVQGISGPHWGSAVVLALGITGASAHVLRKERTNGVLELLAVTPLPRGELLASHRIAVWRQFRWALALMATVGVGVAMIHRQFWPRPSFVWLLALLWTLPTLGFWIATWCRSLVVGILLTAFFGLLTPQFIGTWVKQALLKLWPAWRGVVLESGWSAQDVGLLAGTALIGWAAAALSRRWLNGPNFGSGAAAYSR